ncbi:MAG: hypothetical protein IPO18_08395 [bacterium]|nr:hypothetical protein [bacterium]
MLIVASLVGPNPQEDDPVPGPPKDAGGTFQLAGYRADPWLPGAATNEILATGRVQTVPPRDADGFRTSDATTGSYRVVDEDAHRTGSRRE